MKINKDEFNSKHFGIAMGNVLLDRTYSEKDFAHAMQNLEELKKYCHLTLRVLTNDKVTTNSALKFGFSICDTLVEWMFSLKNPSLPKMEYKVLVRECEEEDLPYIKEIAKSSFKIDRFHSDPNLDNNLCDLYYEKWTENSFYGFAEKVLVAIYNNEVVGFTTIKTYENDPIGHLVLSAVSSKYRGLGIYTCLIHACTKWLIDNHGELEGILVGTQIDNIAVQKAWKKLNYTPYSSSYVLQLSKSEDEL